MARLDLGDIKRDEVGNIVREARDTGKNKKDHLASELRRRYPGIESVRIKRNGVVYNALDYITEDTESYG